MSGHSPPQKSPFPTGPKCYFGGTKSLSPLEAAVYLKTCPWPPAYSEAIKSSPCSPLFLRGNHVRVMSTMIKVQLEKNNTQRLRPIIFLLFIKIPNKRGHICCKAIVWVGNTRSLSNPYLIYSLYIGSPKWSPYFTVTISCQHVNWAIISHNLPPLKWWNYSEACKDIDSHNGHNCP